MKDSPRVSVVLPVYNGLPYLKEAIDSILAQTLGDFEFIIINDGSSDESDAAIRAYDDPRIRYVSQQNQGLAATLNTAIKQARGTYIARQDQDDVSAPERLERQVQFLEEHPKVGMAGSWAKILVEARPTERALKHPVANAEMQFMLLFDSPFVHSAVMIRREVFDTVGFYTTDPERQPPEDYELWSRIARDYELANIPEYLLTYREVEGSMSRAPGSAFVNKVVMVSGENIARASGRAVDDPVVRSLAELTHRQVKVAASRRSILALLHQLSREAGPAAQLQELTAERETLVREWYIHGSVYLAARQAKAAVMHLLPRARGR